MKVLDYVKHIFEEIFRILVYPKKHWERVKNERDIVSGGFRKFFVPGLVLIVFAVFLGNLLFDSEYGFLFKDSLIEAIRKILVLVLTLLASNMLVYEISRMFKVPVEFEMARKIITYSMLPLVLMTALISLFPFFEVAGVVSLYGLYLMYLGLNILYDVTFSKKFTFIVVLLIAVFLVYAVIAYFLSLLTALIIY